MGREFVEERIGGVRQPLELWCVRWAFEGEGGVAQQAYLIAGGGSDEEIDDLVHLVFVALVRGHCLDAFGVAKGRAIGERPC